MAQATEREPGAEAEELILQTAIFGDLPPEELKTLAATLRLRRYPPEALLFIDPGATVLLYTDGVTEAFDPAAVMFGSEGLEQATLGCSALSAEALCEQIIAAVAAHQGLAAQADDLTLVALRVL